PARRGSRARERRRRRADRNRAGARLRDLLGRVAAAGEAERRPQSPGRRGSHAAALGVPRLAVAARLAIAPSRAIARSARHEAILSADAAEPSCVTNRLRDIDSAPSEVWMGWPRSLAIGALMFASAPQPAASGTSDLARCI